MILQDQNESTMVVDSGVQFLEILAIVGSILGIIITLVFYYFLFYIGYKLYLKARKW